ncbi:hypothetical protein T492DRAFT_309788 [Pavlovales sp. CCMP2436]|nr:hypothetical protein T492DRAFT_309788 [Pavlovales sp. CCMP2436]
MKSVIQKARKKDIDSEARTKVTHALMHRALAETGSEYCIFWRFKPDVDALVVELWLSLDGMMMEPDIGQLYKSSLGDVGLGLAWATSSSKLVRNVTECDIKRFGRLQLASYHRIGSIAWLHVRGGWPGQNGRPGENVEGVLELGTRGDWQALPTFDFFAPAAPSAKSEDGDFDPSQERLQEVLSVSGADYVLYWSFFAQVGELKAIAWRAKDDASMRTSQVDFVRVCVCFNI